LASISHKVLQLDSILPKRLLFFDELTADLIVFKRLNGRAIKRCFTAKVGGHCDLALRSKNMEGVSQLGLEEVSGINGYSRVGTTYKIPARGMGGEDNEDLGLLRRHDGWFR
jgi:hypothetical protein